MANKGKPVEFKESDLPPWKHITCVLKLDCNA